jgi:hypothetical protein
MANSILLVFNVVGAEKELFLNFGNRPEIDGYINRSEDEWNDALKTKIDIYQNLTNPKFGLEIDLWLLQNDTNLFISIQFELVDHKSSEYDNEFVGILLSDTESLNPLNYEDAKIVQFQNISEEVFEYRDYFINDTIFYEDSEAHGDGAAHLDGELIIYEFKLPVESSEGGIEDKRIDAGIFSPFMIIFGTTENYNEEIILMNVVSLYVQFYAYNPGLTSIEILYLTLAVVIFSVIIASYGYYIIQVIKLRKRIEKIRS